jgi:hypothetical protein
MKFNRMDVLVGVTCAIVGLAIVATNTESLTL